MVNHLTFLNASIINRFVAFIVLFQSRSKAEDPEQAILKERAKAMQRAEAEELRQKEANETALQAIGNFRKKQKTGHNSVSPSPSINNNSIVGSPNMSQHNSSNSTHNSQSFSSNTPGKTVSCHHDALMNVVITFSYLLSCRCQGGSRGLT